MLNHIGTTPGRENVLRDHLPTVNCKSCAVGTPIRAFPELRDCPQTNKMVNAEVERFCLFYVGVEK